jgi:diguanylate cyclase (GGDEF)-like protein
MPGTGEHRPRRLTVARTLKLTSGLVLVAFTVSVIALLLSIRSIDESFDHVVTVDQPSREAATDMIAAADAASIAFLESLVLGRTVSSEEAVAGFDRAMARYEDLVRRASTEDLSEPARTAFEELKRLGESLIADDRRRQENLLTIQLIFQEMDAVIEAHAALGFLDDRVAASARWAGIYGAIPSPGYKADSLAEIDTLIGELQAGPASFPRSDRAMAGELLADARRARRLQVSVVLLTERLDTQTVPAFLHARRQLDAVLNEGIDSGVRASLERRSAIAEDAVERSRTVLLVSLAVSVVLGMAALLWVRARITRPVARLMAAIEHGEAEQASAALDRNDEFGVLARALAEAADGRMALERELRRQALHDPLTGLANRTLFKERVERALADGGDQSKVAVAFLDLDDFKTVNDSLGHAAGDELLVKVAQRVSDSVKTSDTAARLGGDEFAVLLEDVDDIAVPAGRILDALADPFQLEGRQVTVRGSIGIAPYQEGQSAAELLRNADAAMYSAKFQGKGRYLVFDQAMHSAAVHRFELKNELEMAIVNHEFQLVYQPVVELSTRRRVAVEALIRWDQPGRGLVSPGDFLPLAEETGAIVEIGRWVLNDACERAVEWRRAPRSEDLRLSVNVSPTQLKDPGFAEDVSRALADSGLPAAALVLEITENVFLLDDEEIASVLDRLVALGVTIAIDDFGSGYSSLGYLSKLPIGILKIDRSITSGIDRDPHEAAVAKAILGLGNALGLEIIAEGIETPGQLAELERHGCRLGQGFLLGRPAKPDLSDLADAVL